MENIASERQKGMSKSQLKDLEGMVRKEAVIAADELTDKTPRTLLYGYNMDRETFHIYLDEEGFLNRILYASSNKPKLIHHLKEKEMVVSLFHPGKRAYPEKTDFEFAKLVFEKGVNIPYTTYNEGTEEAYFYGFTLSEML